MDGSQSGALFAGSAQAGTATPAGAPDEGGVVADATLEGGTPPTMFGVNPVAARGKVVTAPTLDEFAALARGVEVAARDWGVQPDSPEFRFVSAMLGTANWLGRLGVASQAELAATLAGGRRIAEEEAARARNLAKAAQIALDQARSAQISSQVAQEMVVTRMISDTLPLFAQKLEKALVIREKRWNARARLRGYAMVAGITLAVFGGGYASRTWQDDGLTTIEAVSLLGDCLSHPLESKGRLYCDVTRVAHPELR